MARKLLTALFIGGTLVIAGCNTVRGAAQFFNTATASTENAMHGGKC